MPIWVWVAFNIMILAMLAVDLGVYHRQAHKVGLREAAIWSSVWIGVALLFAYGVFELIGKRAALEYLAGYALEKSLSVDNIFVIVLIFSYFHVPPRYQHRVLFWGILGALAMRGALIASGAFLIQRFNWIGYLLGAILVISAVRMAIRQERSIKPEANPFVRLAQRLVPITNRYHGQSFLVKTRLGATGGVKLVATPLLLVLVLVETTDLIFALDSIPAIFAITDDPFLIYTSNVFAVLGLRSLYFLLAGIVRKFHYLRLGLAMILLLAGLKMLAADFVEISVGVALGAIAAILVISVVASLLFPKRVARRSPVLHEPLAPRPEPALAPIASDPSLDEAVAEVLEKLKQGEG